MLLYLPGWAMETKGTGQSLWRSAAQDIGVELAIANSDGSYIRATSAVVCYCTMTFENAHRTVLREVPGLVAELAGWSTRPPT